MSKQKSKIILIGISLLLVILVALFFYLRDGRNIPLGTSSEQTLEERIENAIVGKQTNAYADSEDEAFFRDVAEQFSDKNDDTKILSIYSSLTKVETKTVDNDIATIEIDVPDFAKIIEAAVASLSDSEKNSENAIVLVNEKILELLNTENYERVKTEVTVSYTTNADGSINIVESKEYVNALYGGMLTAVENKMGLINAE